MSIMGAFFYGMKIVVKKNFEKPWIDHDSQVKKLIDRGLQVADIESAKRFLSYINYYRFTGFCLRFQTVDPASGERVFNPGVSFEDVRTLCVIDRDLRDCFSEGLELVEISLRSSVAYHFARQHGAFGHLSAKNFSKAFSRQVPSANSKTQIVVPYKEWHKSLVSETTRSRELFVRHFEQAYHEYPDLPVWVVSELCSFGTLSKMYWNMLTADQTVIAKEYGVPFFVLDSWLHTLTFLRNVCAHHGRLWDKKLNIAPKLPSGKNWMNVSSRARTIFIPALILNWMLAHDSIDANAHTAWKAKLEKILDALACELPQLMYYTGFPLDWKRNPLWWQV